MDSAELKRRFGRQVQGLREAKGLTQEQLADRIGRSVDTVGNIERGVNATRIEVAYQIATELDVRLPDLFTFEAAPGPSEVGRSAASTALANILADCDERTAGLLLDMVRLALKLAKAS
ncbi:helix-turn-helix domain-containing protein [Methylobacterium sp. E-041]|uniref:helix-turn-helix transcriptional regulator n=1 Tax=Methylobacterium sp. E-041 TaxID=2836573 RepID=UPI001FBAEF5F|nr:helix-turn-helix transcriptional regulator [Methylobacterium sp. E-041]MCJ2109014.1 helix-turn-helix domain-containing protein [Methylobacterium sp. E-041]